MSSSSEVPPGKAAKAAFSESRPQLTDAALEQERHFLHNYAMSLVKNEDKADDLVQDTYERALKSKDQFQPGTDLRGWLSTILFRRNIELNRRNKWWALGDPEDHYDKLTTAASQGGELDAKQLAALLDRLSPDHKAVLELLGKDYEYQEIADELGIAIGTVKSRANRARQAFAKVLLAAGYIDTDNATVVRFLDAEAGKA